jgi:pyruvate formate lyase activating enzyme
MTSGIIFDIKRFAIHDGPGLRTTVFLKGCPLSCLGCHNPEGQGKGPELVFRPDRCTACGDCVPACPQEAIALVWREAVGGPEVGPNGARGIEIAWDRCDLNGACVEVCLPGALELVGEAKGVQEILDLLEADRIYFDESSGGVTFSGGEPFAQPDVLRELLLGCSERELPVVLDTCGHVEPVIFQELAPLASQLLFDLKLMDEERHEHYTGVHNRWILENLRWAGRQTRPVLTVRVPLIPGVNDDEENLRSTGRFIAGLPEVPRVDLLPYHRLGVDKYGRMGRRYNLGDVAPPPEETVLFAVGLLESAGLSVSVRGENHDHD